MSLLTPSSSASLWNIFAQTRPMLVECPGAYRSVLHHFSLPRELYAWQSFHPILWLTSLPSALVLAPYPDCKAIQAAMTPRKPMVALSSSIGLSGPSSARLDRIHHRPKRGLREPAFARSSVHIMPNSTSHPGTIPRQPSTSPRSSWARRWRSSTSTYSSRSNYPSPHPRTLPGCHTPQGSPRTSSCSPSTCQRRRSSCCSPSRRAPGTSGRVMTSPRASTGSGSRRDRLSSTPARPWTSPSRPGGRMSSSGR